MSPFEVLIFPLSLSYTFQTVIVLFRMYLCVHAVVGSVALSRTVSI